MPLAHDHLYVLEKSIWTETDFDQMGWHDSYIHAISSNPENFELLFDIDYIYAWVDPAPGEEYFNFWVSPCTWIFRNAYDLDIQIEGGLDLEIDNVSRTDAGEPKNKDYITENHQWRWTISCQNGEISLTSVGFTQYTRGKPVRQQGQVLDKPERGGISFDRITYDNKSS